MPQSTFPQFDNTRALNLSVGAISPLWPVFFSAAATGVALYWLNGWRNAANLEALLSLPEKSADVAASATLAATEFAIKAAETAAEGVIEPLLETAPDVAAALMPEPVAPPLEPDDLTQMVGIGPKVAAALADRGVTRFEQIADWTDDDISAVEQGLRLMGRVKREKWVAQARRLARQAERGEQAVSRH